MIQPSKFNSVCSQETTNWWEVVCACGNKMRNLDFSKIIRSHFYELVDHWIKHVADFTLYPLSERDMWPEQIGSMKRALRQMDA